MNKDIILEKALNQFIKFGINFDLSELAKINIQISDISKQLEVPEKDIKEYYSSKEEILNDLFFYCQDSVIGYIKNGFDSSKPAEENVYHVILKLIEWGVKNPEQFSLIQQFTNSSYITTPIIGESLKKVDFIIDIIEKGKIEKTIKNSPTPLLTDILFGLSTRTVSYFIRDKDQLDSQHIEDAQKIIWDSIKNNIIFL